MELFCVSEQSHGKLSVQIKRLARMRRYFKRNRDCLIYSFSVMGTIFGALSTHHPVNGLELSDNFLQSAVQIVRIHTLSHTSTSRK